MDPITALALACNVTQLVEQAIEAVVACKEIYERGSLDENNQIDKYAESVTIANKELEASLKNGAATRDTRLPKLAQDVFDTATELRKVLSLLKLAKSQGVRHLGRAFKTALKSKIQNGTVEKLRERLERQDTALRSSILKDLYLRGGKAELTRRDEFQKLSQGQKDIIANVLHGQKLLLSDIQTSVKAAETNLLARLDIQDTQLQQNTQVVVNEINTSVKKSEDRVIDRFESQDVLLKEHAQKQDAQISRTDEEVHDALRVRLLDALAFPEMNERRNMIEGRVNDFGESYHWLFHLQEEMAEHKFVEWLQTGTEIYWVSGKPGSGKSTLMDFICQSLQPEGLGYLHLKRWAEPDQVRLLSFWFFRPAPSVLLKSLQGFWRSLCFQILDTDDTLVEKIREDEAAPVSLRSCLVKPGSRARTWTDTELKSWFNYLITHSVFSHCLLIDGLDEVTSNRDILLDTIQLIANRTDKIKICCSSRPEAPFWQALQHRPSLRLQDFNYNDIENYCHRRLASTRAMTYVDRICRRAEGVFLWAYLVAEDLREAANNGDDEEDIELRLKECPSGMNELFKFLLERQDKFYTKYPKPYLRLIEVATREKGDLTGNADVALSLLELLVASSAQDDFILDFPENLNAALLASLDSKAAALKANVVTRCANMIELVPRRDHGYLYSDEFPYKELADAAELEVRFIHRSARDFLVDNNTAATLLQSCHMTDQDAIIRLTIASVFTFLVDVESNVDISLGWGNLIEARFWAEAGTKILDIIFPTLQARKPFVMPSTTNDVAVEYDPPFPVLCPQLSALENVVFGFAARFNMAAYAKAKLLALDPGKLPFVVGFAFCLNLRELPFGSPARDFHDMLEPYLSSKLLAQQLSLCYFLDRYLYPGYQFYATCPVWQHIYLSIVDRSYLEGPAMPKRDLLSLYQDQTGGGSSGREPLPVEGCIMRIRYIHALVQIYPMPDEAADSFTETFEVDVFKIYATTYEIAEGRAYSLEFAQYAPATFGRFLELEHAHKEALQQIFFEAESLSHAYSASHECLLAIIKHHLSSLSPNEIANVILQHDEYPYFIFSEGDLQFVDKAARNGWEEWLFEGDMYGHFVDDPVVSQIIKEMKRGWKWEPIRERLLERTGGGTTGTGDPTPNPGILTDFTSSEN